MPPITPPFPLRRPLVDLLPLRGTGFGLERRVAIRGELAVFAVEPGRVTWILGTTVLPLASVMAMSRWAFATDADLKIDRAYVLLRGTQGSILVCARENELTVMCCMVGVSGVGQDSEAASGLPAQVVVDGVAVKALLVKAASCDALKAQRLMG